MAGASIENGVGGVAQAQPSASTVTISSPDRVVYAGPKITKAQVADYYTRVGRWILPDLRRRPLSVVRCPSGTAHECFFQKHHKAALGKRVRAVSLRQKSGLEDYIYVDDLDGLLQLVQMNTLEFHTWGSTIDAPELPDRIVFDLDPGDGVEWTEVIAAAREIRDRLRKRGLQSFVRLSGGKGLHVVAPINRGPSWDQAREFCGAFAQALEADRPQRYVASMSKAKRPGRIFVDWLRNSRGATSVCSWSLRAREKATVAVPLRWEDLGAVASPDQFTMDRALQRAARLRKDPWAAMHGLAQDLPQAWATDNKKGRPKPSPGDA